MRRTTTSAIGNRLLAAGSSCTRRRPRHCTIPSFAHPTNLTTPSSFRRGDFSAASTTPHVGTFLEHRRPPCLDYHRGTARFSTLSGGGIGGDGGGGGEGGGSTNVAFDRTVKIRQRSRAAVRRQLVRAEEEGNDDCGDGDRATTKQQVAVDYDYFHREIAARLIDRLDDIVRDQGFPLALDVGSGPGYLHDVIDSDDAFGDMGGGIGGIKKLVQIDSSDHMLRREEGGEKKGVHQRCDTYRMTLDEESRWPFPDGTFDLVLSANSMHWINDLPTFLSQARRVLKPDGCLLFAMIGGSTLPELRSSFVLGETERDGGVSTHVGPFVDLPDVGSLLTNAGFVLTTVDVDTVRVGYPDAFVLMEHLQRMGENNACLHRRKRVSRDALLATACVYDYMYRLDDGNGEGRSSSSGSVEASVQVIYAIGWTPHESQPRPLERGSATHRVGEDVDVGGTKTTEEK